MRILITNDDGVFAPGIAALARGLHAAFGDEHELVVVAPLTDHSGAGAAVGPVYERESIPYEHVDIPGLADVPTYGIDGSPALSVILACIEGFGPRPDLVVSGINHGINAGRSALHSGTVGAALTGAQFGVRGPGRLHRLGHRAGLLGDGRRPGLRDRARCWPRPSRPPCSTSTSRRSSPPTCRGSATARSAGSGLIRSVRPEHTPLPGRGPGRRPDRGRHRAGPAGRSGEDADRLKERAELEPDSDAALVEAGWASVTAAGRRARERVRRRGGRPGRGPGDPPGLTSRRLRPGPAAGRQPAGAAQLGVEPVEGDLGRQAQVVRLAVGRGPVGRAEDP